METTKSHRPGTDRRTGLPADGNEAQLAALAEHAHFAGQQILQALDIQRNQFGQSQA